MKNKRMKRYAIAFLLLLTVTLQACSSLGGTPASTARATWTPQAQSTDQPYYVEQSEYSFLGDDAVVAIFGSKNPEKITPLRTDNLTTDDIYDVSAITPDSMDTWSRPIMTEDKVIFFQVGGMLYKLMPGGGMSSIEIPFDEEDPVFCNWSWQGQLVCVNDLMTQGFLVDQDLDVTEMSLPAYTITSDTVAFYKPYRAGDNTMRILQTTTISVGSRFAVHYRDLDLTTLTVTDKQAVMAFNFRRKIDMTEYGSYSMPNIYELYDDQLVVLGMTDDAEQFFLQYYLGAKDDSGNWVGGTSWAEIATTEDVTPEYIKQVRTLNNQKNMFYHEFFITPWRNRLSEGKLLFPEVYNVRTGRMLINSVDAFEEREYEVKIWPYRDGWLVGTYYGFSYMNEYGYLMESYYFSDEVLALFTNDTFYTITQPMEP